MIKIAICDDEKNIRSYLASLIRGQNTDCEITEYASADEYLSSGMGHDLLFLDIELEGSKSGMDGNAINGMGMACYGSEIDDLIVNKKFQNKGYGKQLLLWGMNYIRQSSNESISLHVAKWNEKALKLYEKVGFNITNAEIVR